MKENDPKSKKATGQVAWKDENYEITILDNIKLKVFQFQRYRLQDVVQFHSQALLENQVMSNHFRCMVTFRGVEFYGFEMLFAALRLEDHPEVLKDLMAVTNMQEAIKKSDEYEDVL